MLGRKDYTREELEHARSAVNRQLAAYRKLVAALDDAGDDPNIATALGAFEPLLFANMTLVLDRYFVHRLRSVTGKDGNPLNEVELLADSLMNNGGELRGNNVIRYKRDESVLKLDIGQPIRVAATEFERLSQAFFDDLETKFVR
jgi:hypothetical protein